MQCYLLYKRIRMGLIIIYWEYLNAKVEFLSVFVTIFQSAGDLTSCGLEYLLHFCIQGNANSFHSSVCSKDTYIYTGREFRLIYNHHGLRWSWCIVLILVDKHKNKSIYKNQELANICFSVTENLLLGNSHREGKKIKLYK